MRRRFCTHAILLTIVLTTFSPTHAAEDDVRLLIRPSRVEAVIDCTGDFAGLAAKHGAILRWASDHGWEPVGPSESVYLTDATTPVAKRRSQARVPLNIYGNVLPTVSGGAEQVRLERRPAELVLTTQHRGPLTQILPAYERVRERLSALKLRAPGPMHEIYLRDATQVTASELLTEVQYRVEPIGPVDVGIYVGAGAFAKEISAASLCFSSDGLRVRPITATEIRDGSFAKQMRAIYFPGGWAEHYVRDVGSEGAEKLRAFVESGGGYLGVCAGSFFAAKRIHWAGADLDYNLDLFPGTPTGPLVDIATWPNYCMTTVKVVGKHPITRKRGGKRSVLYYGGPSLRPAKGSEVSVLATYATGDPAMVAFQRGKGRVFLSSAHIDYDLTSDRDGTDWPEREKGIDDKESDWDLLQSAARWVLDARN